MVQLDLQLARDMAQAYLDFMLPLVGIVMTLAGSLAIHFARELVPSTLALDGRTR